MPEQAVTPRGGEPGVAGVLPEYRTIGVGLAIAPTVSVVIPAKNEARNLGHVFATIPDWIDEIVLVDGHSTDDTVAVARQLCPDVKVVAQQGRGKGDALQAGFEACKGEIIVMLDADGSTDGAEIARFVGALVTGANYAKGSRFASGGGSDDITVTRRCGNWLLSTLVNRLFGTRYTDLCYGYNAFWARHLPALSLDCDGFEVETVMNIRAATAGLWIQEVPSYEHSRVHGESNLRVIRDGWRIAKVIVRERFLSRKRRQLQDGKTPVAEIPAPSLVAAQVTEGAWSMVDVRNGSDLGRTTRQPIVEISLSSESADHGRCWQQKPGDQVGQADGSVMSRPAEMAARVEPSAAEAVGAEPGGGIKASDATVVVATYDPKRWPFLAAAVESLLSGPDRPKRVVISVDQNEELYERIRVTWPQVTALLNTGEPGASGTRNTGAEYADTPFIVFLDDDIRVQEGWLTRLLTPFADPAVVGTGGGVVAGWHSGRPSWFPEEFGWVVGASYRGMPTMRSTVRNVWSENMAVRTDVFRAVGGFRTGFGKVGSCSRPEDTDLCIRTAASVAGARWIYAPDAVTEHHVPASRATFSYFLRRSYHEGRGKVEMARLLGRQEKLQDERDYLRRTLPAGISTGLWSAFRHGDLSGLLKAGAIIAGFLAAGFGAAAGMWNPSGR